MFRLPLVLLLLALCPPGPRQFDLQGLTISAEPGRWTLEPQGGGRFRLACDGAACHRTTWMHISIAPETEAPCTGEALAAATPHDRDDPPQLARHDLASGLLLLVARGDTGCRNLTPPTVTACVSHAGRTWTFSPPNELCRGVPGSHLPVLAMLETLAPTR